GQKGKTDECRVDINFEFLKPGQKAVFREIGTGQNQGGDLGNRRVIKIQAIHQMKKNRNAQTGQKKASGQEAAQAAFVDRILHQLGNPEEGKIHSFIVKPLPAENIDEAKHDKIAEKDKAAPYKK